MKITSTLEHYELLIDEGNDPVQDPPELHTYMSRWDGPLFFNSLIPKNKVVLDIGVGTGRIAKEVLEMDCKYLVGIDISPKTLDRAKSNLSRYANVELVNSDINHFIRPNTFDVAYSVLTFLHIEDKTKALLNIYSSLKNNGTIVLSVSNDEEWLECNDRFIKLYPIEVEEYIHLLQLVGFQIESIQETESKYATIIKGMK
ncbi:class I SAM-dependent methyltransferase [Paenibacillus wynnii]|uniref:class I SAM-dependent methyltransferase n=1 Tax=Paenibacillus wynnii TaxID=268407 RepID=UPI00278D6042|nr:class I SAM-dependent methyltransferase [Paenibacillus wynnii]MDQ0193282.1 ubiquinone/menaquinone biosynthesis C-methylase UbiE [Paenibacillus wynnii]